MNILVIIGSAGKQSSGSRLMAMFRELTVPDFKLTLWEDLESLPHFDPSLTSSLPATVAAILSQIELADGVVFCTPEYIFSIPARLKNLLEWCVATTVFTDKPVGIITASANGEQGHAQLQLIMHTLGAKLNEAAQLLIKGIKGKFDSQGVLLDSDVLQALVKFSTGFKILLAEP